MIDGTRESLIRQVCKQIFVPSNGDLPDDELLERFVTRRDQAAFELLAWRHSPMVLGVCRRLLRHEQDAEDALQATLLTFARKADTIGKRESLGSWLYKVAYRTSLKARTAAAMRTAREIRPTENPSPDPSEEAAWRELMPILDAEVNSLPDHYRIPFVLHCLEGRTLEEVARRLGRPLATVGTQVRRARQRLTDQLGRRGLALTASVLACVLKPTPGACTPAELMASTLRAAALVIRGESLTGHVSTGVIALTTPAFGATVIKKTLAALSVLVGLIVGGAVLSALDSRPESKDDRPAPRPAGLPDQAAPQVQAMLEEALKTTPLIQDPTQRVWILCDIARMKARLGQQDGAAATVRLALVAVKGLDDEQLQGHRLRDVARCQADIGDIEGALATAGSIPSPDERAGAVADIAAAQAGAGRVAEARRTAQRITASKFREGDALRRIAIAQARAGDFGAAVGTLAAVTDSPRKPRYLAAIAAEQARTGDPVAARHLFDEAVRMADDLRGAERGEARDTVLTILAGTQAAVGRIEEAGRTADEITSARSRDEAWKRITAALAKRGDPKNALRTADRIGDQSSRAQALVGVVAGLARAKDLAKAQEVLETIRDDLWRVYALVELARGQSGVGRRDDAVRTLRDARQLAGQIRDNQRLENVAPYALANLAEELRAVGQEKEVLAWLDQQPSPLVKARALVRMAEGLVGPPKTGWGDK
jgi:RNA polymerase sigma factor (sigma-70 family)